jgi:hypothetical protein
MLYALCSMLFALFCLTGQTAAIILILHMVITPLLLPTEYFVPLYPPRLTIMAEETVSTVMNNMQVLAELSLPLLVGPTNMSYLLPYLQIRLLSCQPCNVGKSVVYYLHNQPGRIGYEEIHRDTCRRRT